MYTKWLIECWMLWKLMGKQWSVLKPARKFYHDPAELNNLTWKTESHLRNTS